MVEPENPGQERLYESEQKVDRLSKEEYDSHDKQVTAACAEHGIDNVLRKLGLDVIIGPADSLVPNVTALARMCCSHTRLKRENVDPFCKIPSVTLPLSYLDLNDRPFELLAIASAYQENLLLDVARAWESTFPPRRVPPRLENDELSAVSS